MENNDLKESETIEYKKVKLKRNWCFWENYEQKQDEKETKDYLQYLKEVFNFNDLITFWQFWNKYPGSDPRQIFYDGETVKYFFEEKKRINAINLFETGIVPDWETEELKNCKIFLLEYQVDRDIDKFLDAMTITWTKLVCLTIGETIPFSEYIKGVRFVDKTKPNANRRIIYKFEVWASRDLNEENKEKLKEYLKTEYSCEGIRVK